VKPRYFWWLSFVTLESVAEVVIEGDRVPSHEVAMNVDQYLADLRARNKWLLQIGLVALCLRPIFSGRPPLPLMPPKRRRNFLNKHLLRDVATFRSIRGVTRAMVRMSSQLVYLGYYGDQRSWNAIGYVPFRDRQPLVPPVPRTDPPRLQTLAGPPGGSQLSYDSLVIGSGAAGSILAWRLAAAGRRVLILERGPHVDSREFSDNEVQQYLSLYNEGALQLTRDFSLQVFQGMCVGGGTTVNNALCFAPPQDVLDEWRTHGIDANGLSASIDRVRRMVHVAPVDQLTASPAGRDFEGAALRLRKQGLITGTVERMNANLSNCVGCGYCNIGCAYGARVSMLDRLLPWAQAEYDGHLDILADFEVAKVERNKEKAIGVWGTHLPTGQKVFIRAWQEVVIAAGAIHSSWILRKSGIATAKVGKELHFNYGTPLTAEFRDPVDAFAGVQMSHAYYPVTNAPPSRFPYPEGRPEFLIETWFNPPATQATSMPGWFDQHFEIMRRYRKMASVGVLVGTTSPSEVGCQWGGGPAIRFRASPHDMERLKEGMKQATKILWEAGATRVMPATYDWIALPKGRDDLLDRLDTIRDGTDILLSTSHPQGGNAIGRAEKGGVVDDCFRVYGFGNLYVCDASVFPSGIHVQPQLTVMAMADYGATKILGPTTTVPPVPRLLPPLPPAPVPSAPGMP
jgi:choline dehydrogenase-like flavoprotein